MAHLKSSGFLSSLVMPLNINKSTLCSEHPSRFNLFGGKQAKAFYTSSERAKNITVFLPYILSKEGAQTPLHQFTPSHRNPSNKEQGLQIEVNKMLKKHH